MEQPLASLQIDISADERVLRRFWAYACATWSEVSALCEADLSHDESGGLRIYIPDAVHLLAQEGGYASTDLDMDAVADLIKRQVQAGKNPARLRLWYHTHGSMESFFSITDDRTINKLSELCSPLVAVCVNKDGSTIWRVVHQGCSLQWRFQMPGAAPAGEELARAKTEVQKVVKTTPWESFAHGGWEGKWWKKDRQKATKIKIQLIRGKNETFVKVPQGITLKEFAERFNLMGKLAISYGKELTWTYPIDTFTLFDGDRVREDSFRVHALHKEEEDDLPFPPHFPAA